MQYTNESIKVGFKFVSHKTGRTLEVISDLPNERVMIKSSDGSSSTHSVILIVAHLNDGKYFECKPNSNIIQPGARVRRMQPGDYTDGRMGNVIEVNTETSRARVYWDTRKDWKGLGSESKRTWVKFSALHTI